MSGSCKHQKRCGLLLLRLLYIFLNKIHKKKNKKKSIYTLSELISTNLKAATVCNNLIKRF